MSENYVHMSLKDYDDMKEELKSLKDGLVECVSVSSNFSQIKRYLVKKEMAEVIERIKTECKENCKKEYEREILALQKATGELAQEKIDLIRETSLFSFIKYKLKYRRNI
jgi:hypothetical protein